MFQHGSRGGHHLLLIVLWAVCCLINLGGPTLWDIDEPLNSQAAQEMRDSGNLVVPTFNGQLRTAKPALLYWLQLAAYQTLGSNEAAARLPSALAALVGVLTVYELGRFLFGAGTGLLAGVILSTTVSFLGAAHFANPDALLVTFTTLTLAFFFHDWQTGRRGWLAAAAAACGLAVLAKGPAGLVLPGLIVVLFLLWQRRLAHLLDTRLAWAVGVFLLIALPWYVFVGIETRGVFLREFFFTENIRRSVTVMEGTSGPFYYYLVVLLIGLVPWTVFFGPTVLYVWRQLRSDSGLSPETAAVRFLSVWVGVVLAVFSAASTKLPNYILPLYPAAALLTARMLVRWQEGTLALPTWMLRLSMACLALTGVGVSAGLLLVGGVVEVPALWPVLMPGMLSWAWAGMVLVLGAAAGWYMLLRERRAEMIAAVAVSAAVFVSVTAAGVLPVVNAVKPSAGLASLLPADHEYREVRLATCRWFQPSLVFYSRREVVRIDGEGDVREFLEDAVPGYLFLPEREWNEMRGRMPADARVLGKRRDMYSRLEIVVVTREREPQADLPIAHFSP